VATKAKVEISFIGASNIIRVIDDYVWNKENGFVCAVDLETAANLLTYPRPQFAATPGQKPTAAVIKTLAELTSLSSSDIKALFGGN